MNLNLINNNEYTKFIINNNTLTKCAKDMILNLHKLKNTVYIDSKDKFQMYYYYQKAVESKDRTLVDLLLHFTNIKTIELIEKKLKSKSKKVSDVDIITIIGKSGGSIQKDEICSKWDFVFQNLANKCFELFGKDKFNYLDISCGNCKKTVKFGQYLNLDYKSIYGCDIPHWGPYGEGKKKPVQFDLIKDGKLPYKDNFFKMVSIMFSLHHIESLKDFIKEMRRIVMPGGYLILIEHDMFNDYDKILIDIEHKIYGVLYDDRPDYCDKPDFMTTYNRYEWDFLLSKVGFKNVFSDVLYFDVDRHIRYDKPFYSIYCLGN